MKYAFMADQQTQYPIRLMSRVLGVSSSGYYAWRKREPSQRERANRALLEQIRAIFKRSRATYGSPRIQAELPLEIGEAMIAHYDNGGFVAVTL